MNTGSQLNWFQEAAGVFITLREPRHDHNISDGEKYVEFEAFYPNSGWNKEKFT